MTERGSGVDLLIPSFSPEALVGLESQGYRIFDLQGLSVGELRQKGMRVSSTWHDLPRIETSVLEDKTDPVQVAIKPEDPFMERSLNLIGQAHSRMIRDFSKEIAKEIRGVRAVQGETSQYAELVFLYQQLGLERLFGKRFTRTTNSAFRINNYWDVIIGDDDPVRGTCIDVTSPFANIESLWALPLIVPAA